MPYILICGVYFFNNLGRRLIITYALAINVRRHNDISNHIPKVQQRLIKILAGQGVKETGLI